jgi:hypothetical protein
MTSTQPEVKLTGKKLTKNNKIESNADREVSSRCLEAVLKSAAKA